MRDKVIFLLIALSLSAQVFALDLKSGSFKDREYIPHEYTCTAQNLSPSFTWSNVPQGVMSFALICDDPDAPRGTWVHWVVFNIPANTRRLRVNITTKELLLTGALVGRNDFGDTNYGGPCPPPGNSHRYLFKLYALSKKLKLETGASKSEIIKAMRWHILAETKIIGKYKR